MLDALKSRFTRLALAWRKRRSRKLARKAAALPEDKVCDLVFLQSEGFVQARATGQSITLVFGEVENLLDRSLRVRAEPGTCFVAQGAHQNMVTRRPYRFTLAALETRRMSIEAACANASRPVPTGRDRFAGVRQAPADLARFLDAAQGADPMAVQAGVWALTDNYSQHDVQNRLFQEDRYGRRVAAVSAAQVAEARRILAQLGLANRL